MRNLLIAIMLVALLVAVAGCKITPTEPTGTVGEVSEGIDDIGTLEEDTSIEELNNLDSELNEVDW